MNQIVNANIQPKAKTHRVNYEQAKLLFVIGRKIDFDLPKFIFDNIRIATKVPDIGLPYGALITRILLLSNILISTVEELKRPIIEISHGTVNKETHEEILEERSINILSEEEEIVVARPIVEVGESSSSAGQIKVLH